MKAHMRAEISKHLSVHVFWKVSFLYIVVLCQFWLVELSRFQYYFDCNCIFDLFDCTKIYSCEVSLLLSQLISELCLWLIELYSSFCEVKNSLINFLCSMSRNLLHTQAVQFCMINNFNRWYLAFFQIISCQFQ